MSALTKIQAAHDASAAERITWATSGMSEEEAKRAQIEFDMSLPAFREFLVFVVAHLVEMGFDGEDFSVALTERRDATVTLTGLDRTLRAIDTKFTPGDASWADQSRIEVYDGDTLVRHLADIQL